MCMHGALRGTAVTVIVFLPPTRYSRSSGSTAALTRIKMLLLDE